MDSFTFWYVPGQIVVLLVILIILWRSKGWYAHTNTAASILTVVGVLGTFIGIYIGLQEFNPRALEDSIPDLLDGLKIAFRTSIVGIGSALLLKGIISPLVQTFQNKGDQDPIDEAINKFILALKDVETSGENNLSSKLDELTKATKDEERDTGTVLGGINDIKTALTGESEQTIPTQLQNLLKVVSESRLNAIEMSLSDEEGNLLTELRSLKNEISTKHDDLRKEFQTFSKNVAESVAKLATDELIEALREVISDFNKNLTEQFGENFKHLNEAVDKTVEWQEQYRQQMDELANEFRMAAESIEQSRESVKQIAEASGEIAESSCSIVACAEDIEPLLHTLNDQLEAFSELRQKALDAFPLIENQLTELTKGFSSAVQATISGSHESMEAQRAALTEQTKHLQTTIENTTLNFNQLTMLFSKSVETSIDQAHDSMNQQREELTNRFDNLKSAMNTSSNQIQDIVNSIGGQLDTVFKKSALHIDQITTNFIQSLTGELNQLLESQSQQLGNIVERNREDMENHVKILHTELRKELAESLTKLAGYLDSLSTGFVDNYGRLTGSYTQAMAQIEQLLETHRRMP